MSRIFDFKMFDGQYTDRQGQVKTRWKQLGFIIFPDEVVIPQGTKISAQLDMIPGYEDKDGKWQQRWIQVYERTQRTTSPAQARGRSAPPQGGGGQNFPGDPQYTPPDDDVPF